MIRYVLYTPALRAAHLERLAPVPGVSLSVVATGRHPDCDPALLARPPVPVTVSSLDDLATRLAADPPDVLEVTEPSWGAEWPASLRLANAVPSARLTTYAIDNLTPAPVVGAGRLHAVVFGTRAAQAAYADLTRAGGWRTRVEEERRPRCATCFPAMARVRVARREVVYVAEFSERKGIDLLLAGWPEVAAAHPGWRLRLCGYGPRTDEVLRWAAGRPGVTVTVDPGRAAVHAALSTASVLVLPSRRVAGWREQVGLSLVEALAHGCRVVTTTETGLADGLAAAGHDVLEPDSVAALVGGLRRALTGIPDMLTLPATRIDSRMCAIAWLAGAVSAGADSQPERGARPTLVQ